jgi:AcrR family transcriptional regulator
VDDSPVTDGSFPLPPLDRLPSGRHRLSREAVKSSQRGRLLFAIAQVVAERGYAAATVADIVDRASVSRSTFYEQFPDKQACFIAAFDYGVEFVLAEMERSWRELDGGDWRAHIRSDLRTLIEVLSREPAFARALHVEVLAAGSVALEHRAQILGMFSERTYAVHRRARAQDPTLPALDRNAFELHSGGVDELIRSRLLHDRDADLTDLIDPVSRATLLMLGDRPGGDHRGSLPGAQQSPAPPPAGFRGGQTGRS